MAQIKGLSKNQYIVIHPNKALVKLNDELITYKLIYERISNYLKKSDEKIDKYETVIANLQTEKEQIQIQNKLKLYSVNRENENLKYKLRNTINTLNDDKSYRSTNTPKINNINLHFNSNHNENRNKLPFQNSEKSNRSIEDEEFSKNSSFNNSFNNEEFKEILKQAGLTIENYLILSSNKMNAKLIDTIELMFKLITDKNMTIRILEIENENLNEKNTQLNEENISILSKKNNESMANNTSKITINNLNINSLNAYKNILNKNESVSSKEETGSIIVMKTKQNLNKEEISEKNRCKSSQLRKERILTLENSIAKLE
jgi:hypothetical protein